MRSKIIKNAIRCRHCGDVIESFTSDDFKRCSCGICAVDGGHDYLRRCFAHSSEEDYIDLSESETQSAPVGNDGTETKE